MPYSDVETAFRAPADQTEIGALFDERVRAALDARPSGRLNADCTECGGDPWDRECTTCGPLDCRAKEPLHYAQDGCPACHDDLADAARADSDLED